MNYYRRCIYMAVLVLILGSVLFNACQSPGENGSAGDSDAATGSISNVTVRIDNGVEHQAMAGFGATNLSLVYDGAVGDALGASLRAKAIDAVYNQVGINMGNLEGALLESPGSYGQRSNDNDDPFTFNWSGFQTSGSDAMKTKVVDLAQPYGFNGYFLGQRINIRWASPWLDEIRTLDYDRFLDEAAEQVAAGAIYWRDTYGIVPKYLMLFNEPLSGNRELQNGSVKDVTSLIKRAGERLRSEGFDAIKFVVTNEETEEKSLSVMTSVLSDPDARQYVGIIGYHPYPYGSTYASIPNILNSSGAGAPNSKKVAVRNQIRDLGGKYGIPVWMTEVSHGEVDPRSFDDLRGRAIHIHDELVYANASAYFGMMNMWDTVSQQQHFGNTNIFSESGTIVLIENSSETINISGMGYAIGHYARWITESAVRIDALSDDSLLQVTAFRDDSNSRLTIVIINNSSAERSLDIVLSGLKLAGVVVGEQSTESARWKTIESFELAESNSFTYSVPGKSVTTLAGNINF